MDERTMKKIKAFVKERDEALLTGDIEKVRAYHKKWSPEVKLPDDDVLEISMHKAITACRSLPRSYRIKSLQWLDDHGFSGLDDGDL